MSLKSWTLVAGAAITCAVFACGDDDDSASPRPDAGTTPPDSGTTPPDSGTTEPDSGGTPQLSAYERLGGKEGVRQFVAAEVGKVLADEQLSTYFFRQVATPIPAGSPSGGQIIECFSRLVASVVKAEEYPGAPVNDPANTNTPNFTCRTDFKAMHAGLKIGGGTFDKFVGVIATDLMPLVEKDASKPLETGKISQAEFDALAAALTGTKPDVVDPTAPVGPAPFPG